MLKLAILVLVLSLVWWVFLYRRGNPMFWKLASRHANEAYDWFVSDPNWIVSVAGEGRSPPDSAEYSGPFFLWVPKLDGRRISIYGRRDQLEESQSRFVESIQGRRLGSHSLAQPVTHDAEDMWSSIAVAIVGSGTYELEGINELQVKRLVEWLAVGKQKGYDWKAEYGDIYKRWSTRRPHLPSPREMERLVDSRQISSEPAT